MSASSKDIAGGGGARRRRPARALGVRRWLARAQGLGQGLTVPELVSELHVGRGLPLPEVAQVLGVSLQEVRRHRRRRVAADAVRGPQTEAEVTGLREQVGVALWETVAATFAGMALDGESEGAGAPAPRPPMMVVRMRALKQMAKLYGVGRKKRGGDGVVKDCARPEEIAELVRRRAGRKEG